LKFHNTNLRAFTAGLKFTANTPVTGPWPAVVTRGGRERRVRRSNPSRHASRPGPRAEMRANTRKDEATPRARALRDTSTIRSHTTGAAPWSPTQPRLLAHRPRAYGRRVMHLLCAPDVGLFNRCCPTRSRWATGTRTRRSPVWATGAWTQARRQRLAVAAQATGRHVGRPAWPSRPT